MLRHCCGHMEGPAAHEPAGNDHGGAVLVGGAGGRSRCRSVLWKPQELHRLKRLPVLGQHGKQQPFNPAACSHALLLPCQAVPACAPSARRQLNDVWPGMSWSSVNFGGRWKPSHYSVARLYAPLAVLPTVVPAMQAGGSTGMLEVGATLLVFGEQAAQIEWHGGFPTWLLHHGAFRLQT